MAFTSLRLGAVLLMAASVMVPDIAGARPGRNGNDQAGFSRSYDDRDRAGYRRGSQDGYARDRDDRRERRSFPREDQCRPDGGGILSAVAGGLLGNSGSGRHAAADRDC